MDSTYDVSVHVNMEETGVRRACCLVTDVVHLAAKDDCALFLCTSRLGLIYMEMRLQPSCWTLSVSRLKVVVHLDSD